MRNLKRYVQEDDPAVDPTTMSVFDEWYRPSTQVMKQWDGSAWVTETAGDSDSGTGVVQTATVTLTDVQIKALPNTPITLVAAPGSGAAVLPLGALLVCTKVDGYSTVAASCVLAVVFADNNNNYVEGLAVAAAASLGSAGVHRWSLGGHTLPGAGALAGWNYAPVLTDTTPGASADCALKITAYNGGDDFTAGNASNTLTVTVYYVVVDV